MIHWLMRYKKTVFALFEFRIKPAILTTPANFNPVYSVHFQFRKHPHFGQHIKKLKDFTPDTWRYRIGAWRFFYEKVVSMLSSHSFSLPRHFSHFSPLFFLLFTIQGLTPNFDTKFCDTKFWQIFVVLKPKAALHLAIIYYIFNKLSLFFVPLISAIKY